MELSDRFERLPELLLGSKIRNWHKAYETNGTAEFLSRIWSFYGPPDEITYEGFMYYGFLDKQTGLKFSAYKGPSGPAYGGFYEASNALEAVLNDFDTLLNSASLVDCEVEFETDFGIYRVGVHNGQPFQKKKK